MGHVTNITGQHGRFFAGSLYSILGNPRAIRLAAQHSETYGSGVTENAVLRIALIYTLVQIEP